MTGYMVRVEVPEGEIQEIFQRLEKAQEEIYGCYRNMIQVFGGRVARSATLRSLPMKPRQMPVYIPQCIR